MATKKTTKKAPVAKAPRGKKAAAPAASASGNGGGPESLIVGSKVKAAIKNAGCNTGGDAIDGLNGWVHWLIEQATKRAAANGRKTVRSHDFIVMP